MVRSFELDPAMSHDVRPNLEVLSAKYGVSLAQARALEDRAVALARREGLPFAVFGGRTAIPGAASSEGYAKAIEQAWRQQ